MELLIILLLILLNGVFAMSEIAIVSARKGKLELEAKKGNSKSKLALEIAESPNRFLSTVQIGITLIGILNGVFGGANITNDIKVFLDNYQLLKPYSDTIAVGAVVLFITYFSLVLGELVPKRIGLAYAETIAKAVAQPMNVLSKITSPFIWLLSASSTFILRVLGIKTDKEALITEEEIRAFVEEGASQGSIEAIEQDIVERVFNLGDRRIGSLMTPRQEIVWLDISENEADIKRKIIEHKHSKFLLCEHELENVLGVVFVKDILPSYLENLSLNLSSFKKPVLFIPENLQSYQVFEEFKKTKNHFAVIVNEYGEVVGVATINDIINAIVGNISESDELEQEIVEREDGSVLINGQLSFEDFLNHFKIEEPNRENLDSFHTVAGLILNLATRIPKVGDKVSWNSYQFEIMDMDGKRIDKILFTKTLNEIGD